MVSAPTPITMGIGRGELIWKCAKILTFVAGCTSMGGVKNRWGNNIYYYITTC